MQTTLTLTQTNTGGYVPLCSCGWIGNVHPAPKVSGPKGGKERRDYTAASMSASAEWRRHHTAVHVPLVPIDLHLAVPGLTRRGRYGRP